MTNLKVKTTNPYKRSRLIQKIGLGFLVVGGTFIALYFGYCWGIWGRNSLLLQYIFQCNCPAISEQSQYPANVEIIVSGCQYKKSILSPSGRILYLEEKSRVLRTYLLNLETQNKISFFIPEGSNHFLTDDLLFLSLDYGQRYEGGEYILDVIKGKQYPIQKFVNWHSNAYLDGKLNLNALAEALQTSQDVFLIDDDMLIALNKNFRSSPELSFSIHGVNFPGRDPYRIEQFLNQNNIAYHFVSDIFPSEAVSPDGRFIARADGIYLIETNQKIVEGYSPSGYYRSYSGQYFSVRGWVYDSSGVLYSAFLEPCLLETNFFVFEYPGCFIKVDQPLIKLKVPQEYLDTPIP